MKIVISTKTSHQFGCGLVFKKSGFWVELHKSNYGAGGNGVEPFGFVPSPSGRASAWALGIRAFLNVMNKDIANAASHAMTRADHDALETLVLRAIQELGIREIDGLSIQDWLNQERARQLEKGMLRLGDMNPPAFEAMKATIEAGRKRGGNA